jgi:cardiolipin synthase
MAFDKSVVAIMNFNLSKSSFESNREFGVFSTRSDDVREFLAVFEADWNGDEPSSGPALVESPDESRDQLIELIDEAKTTIEIYAEVVRDLEVVDRLAAAERRGVSVRMAVSPDNDPNAVRIYDELRDAGVEIGFVHGLYIHAKAIVVDRRVAFIGSQNLTATSLDKNREIGIIVGEPEIVRRLEKVFNEDFMDAQRAA